jgi:hypothetical protein
MSRATFQKSGMSFAGMDTGFLNNKLLPFIKALPFDTLITSTFRSLEEQAELRRQYEAGERKAVANKPGYSAHNWGLGVDIHPVSGKDADYDKMLEVSKKFGLKRDAKERWHFQDDRFTFQKAALWLTENKAVSIPLLIFFFLLIAFIYYKYFRK